MSIAFDLSDKPMLVKVTMLLSQCRLVCIAKGITQAGSCDEVPGLGMARWCDPCLVNESLRIIQRDGAEAS